MKKNIIVIEDWTGRELYKGNYKSKEIDKVLKANKCPKCTEEIEENCQECNGTGYSGDFEVFWEDKNDTRNVYEFINY